MFASCEKTNGDDDYNALSVGDAGLVWKDDYWYTGLGVGYSKLDLNFYANGEFEYLIAWTTPFVGSSGGVSLSDEVYKGTYSASNGKLTFKYKSAQYRGDDNGWKWKTISLPATRPVTYKRA